MIVLLRLKREEGLTSEAEPCYTVRYRKERTFGGSYFKQMFNFPSRYFSLENLSFNMQYIPQAFILSFQMTILGEYGNMLKGQ